MSTSEVRQIRVLDDSHADGYSFEPHNFANIVYEYTVSGQKLRNNRVSIGEDRGNFQVAETIARSQRVVPANAGTHNTWRRRLKKGICPSAKMKFRAACDERNCARAGVRALAGTTR